MHLFQINLTDKSLHRIGESTLAEHGFTEPRDLEAWLLNHDSEILNRKMRWIMRQDHLTTDQRSDLIGVDESGELVICELKQGTVVQAALTQALGYAAEYSQMDIEALSRKLLDHSQKGHIKDVAPKTPEEAKQLINAAITENEPGVETLVNESQAIILVGENFEADVLSVADYLNSSSDSDDLKFVIECWRYQLFNIGGGQFQIGFEQVLPPPSVREQVAARREESRSRKYARDPNRVAFMAKFMQAANSTGDLVASRSRGSSYFCKLVYKAVPERQFSFSLYGDHPKIGLPPSVDKSLLDIDLRDKVHQEGDQFVIELDQHMSSNLFEPSDVVAKISDIVKRVANAGA